MTPAPPVRRTPSVVRTIPRARSGCPRRLRPGCRPRPVAVGSLLYGFRFVPQSPDHFANLIECEGRVQRRHEHRPLMVIRFRRVFLHDCIERGVTCRAQQVADEEHSVEAADAVHFSEAREWVGDVVNAAVAEYRAEMFVGEGELLRVGLARRDALGQIQWLRR